MLCIICKKETDSWVVMKDDLCKCRECVICDFRVCDKGAKCKLVVFKNSVFPGEYRHEMESGECYVSASVSPTHLHKIYFNHKVKTPDFSPFIDTPDSRLILTTDYSEAYIQTSLF